MADKLDVILEHLAILESKVDGLMTLAVSLMAQNGVEVTPQVTGNYRCPYCQVLVDFRVNAENGAIERKCGCETGLIPPTSPEELALKLGLISKGERKYGDGTGEAASAEETAIEAAELAEEDAGQRRKR